MKNSNVSLLNKKSSLQKSPSVERNKDAILHVLKQYNPSEGRLLEVGSGTAEHAVYLAPHFTNLQWVTSDQIENHSMIKEFLKERKLQNVHGPEVLKIGEDDFPKGEFQYVFTANTLHIMSWKEVKSFLKLLGKRLREGAVVFIYGPFNYDQKFTSKSNEQFDKWLKERNPKSGIRHYEDVERLLSKSGFKLLKDHEMPANNRVLVFERLMYQGEQ